jgi:hypothetical protein
MATDSTTAKIEIEVEARTDAAVENFNKLKKAEADTKAQLVELDKQASKTEAGVTASSGRMAGGFARAKDAAKQLAPSLAGIGVAAAQGNVNLGNMAAAALAAANAFGPWGIAIAAAGTALFALTKEQREASAAVDALNDKLEKQRRLAASMAVEQKRENRRAVALTDIEAAESAGRRAELTAVKRIEDARQEAIQGARDVIEEQEKQIAVNKQLGVSVEQNLRRVSEAREVIALRSGDLDAAEQVRHEEELRRIDAETAALERKGGVLKKMTGDELALAGRSARAFDADIGAASDRQVVAGGSADESSASRFGGTLIDPFSKENEMQAVAQAEEKRLRAREALKDELAEADKKRDEEELDRKDQLQKRHDSMSEAISGAMGNIAATTLQAALAGEVGIKKLLGAWGRAESIKLAAIALSEGVQAVVAAATWNIPQAIQHGEAAAQAAATAAVVAAMTGAVGGFGSVSVGSSGNGKGFGMGGSASGNNFGGGSGPAANSAPSSTNSQKDQLPTAEYNVQQSGTANMGGPNSGGTVINYNFAQGSVQSLGRIDNETGLKLKQGIDEATRNLGWSGG